jgi:hypothetical protein
MRCRHPLGRARHTLSASGSRPASQAAARTGRLAPRRGRRCGRRSRRMSPPRSSISPVCTPARSSIPQRRRDPLRHPNATRRRFAQCQAPSHDYREGPVDVVAGERWRPARSSSGSDSMTSSSGRRSIPHHRRRLKDPDRGRQSPRCDQTTSKGAAPIAAQRSLAARRARGERADLGRAGESAVLSRSRSR